MNFKSILKSLPLSGGAGGGLLLLLSLVFSACGGDDPINPDPDPGQGGSTTVISLTTKQTTIDCKAWEQEVSISAPENWRAKADADWISFSPSQGVAGTAKLKVKVPENLSTEERSGKITLETIKESKSFFILTIKQKGRDEVATNDENPNAPAGMKKNAPFLVKQIAVGWNLGNTCESSIWEGYDKDVDLWGETAWGNPKTTAEMIAALKQAGFNAVRIPTRWFIHADDDMNIREAWLARVKEIVDYAVSRDMYVILNSHHDNWYDRLPVGYSEEQISARFVKMWTQIATYFRDYDEHLILAGVNEIIKLNSAGAEDWGTPTAENIKFVNRLMQTFVNTVRATGGNNEWRCLLVQPWAASPANALRDEYSLPEDKVKDRLIQEFHCYDPYNYAIGKDIQGNQWAQHEVTDKDRADIAALFLRLNQKFVEQGVPVIMAEFGSTQDNSYSKGNAAADKIRADYHKFIVSEAKKYSIPGFYWDNGVFTGNGENFGLLDRNACNFPERAKIALKGIMDGLK